MSATEETAAELAWSEFLDAWVRQLSWSDQTPPEVSDAVVMNLRAFWGHAKPAFEKIAHQAFSDAAYAAILSYENSDRAAEGFMDRAWPDYEGTYAAQVKP